MLSMLPSRLKFLPMHTKPWLLTLSLSLACLHYAGMLPYLDIESAQHSIDAEQVLDGGIYAAVQGCVGDWGPQDAKGPVQEP